MVFWLAPSELHFVKQKNHPCDEKTVTVADEVAL